jgi:hypothetical protein
MVDDGMSFKRIVSRWLALGWPERSSLLFAFYSLGLARLKLSLLTFKRIAPSLGKVMPGSDANQPQDDNRQAAMFGWAVRTAARYTPWKSTCLVQAIAVNKLLRRHSIPGTLYLGVKKDDVRPSELNAHAWVRSGNRIVTGEGGWQQYEVVSSFCWTRE